MVSNAESSSPMSFDVDEWDENFINEVFQVELGLCSNNAFVNPPDPPLPLNPVSPHPPENEAFQLRDPLPPIRSGRWGWSSSGLDAGGSDAGFSPPRELSQRCKAVSEAASVGNDRLKVESRASRNGGFSRSVCGRGNKDVERLKKELEHLTKKFNHMEQDCNTLKKDRDQKSEQLKCVISQLEAKDNEICSLKMENLGACKVFENKMCPTNCEETCNSKLKNIQTNGSVVSELKRRIMIDDQATTSNEAQECASSERIPLTKHRKTIGIQTDDVGDNNNIFEQKRTLNEQGIVSKLNAIWGLYDKKTGRNMVLKLLRICAADFFTIFRCSGNLDGLANERSSAITLPEDTHSFNSSDDGKVSRFYQLLVKMRLEIVPFQDFIDALLELCNLDNVTIAYASLRILHATLQHSVFDSISQCTMRRSNVFVGPSNDKSFIGDGALPVSSMENSCIDEDDSSINTVASSFENSFNIFEKMRKIVARNVEDCIRLEALLIMSLVMMECKPTKEREKFSSANLLQTLSALMSREVGARVRKQAVRLLFLVLNSPKMSLMLSSKEDDGVDLEKVDNTHNITATWQGAFKSMLENLAECLVSNKNDAEELKFRKRVIILLAFVASSGKAGFEILLSSVTSQQINFLELIIQLIAFEMDAETPDNGATHDLCTQRISFIREALILLNRLSSNPAFSDTTLRVLTGGGRSTECSTVIDVANRLPRRIQDFLKQYGMNKMQALTEINDLARIFRQRVFAFLGVRIC